MLDSRVDDNHVRTLNMLKYLKVLFCAALMAVLCGCDVGDNKADAQGTASHFDIPLTLVEEMQAAAFQTINSQESGAGKSFDVRVCEGLIKHFNMSREVADSVARRPRGKMKFVDDGVTDEERQKLWPIDISEFENSLRRSLVLKDDGYYHVDENGVQLDQCATFRWVNAEIEKWAMKEMDSKFSRLTDVDEIVWRITPNILLLKSPIIPNEWERREYFFFAQLENGGYVPIVKFESFPSPVEATQAILMVDSPRATNNLAVLAWDHRVFLTDFSPLNIRERLLVAMEQGCAEAEQNLAVLRAFIPEVDEPDHQEEEVRKVIIAISSWLEPCLMKGGITEERAGDEIYLRGRVGEINSIFSSMDFVAVVQKGNRLVTFFAYMPTVAQEEHYENIAELISRGEMEHGLSSAWLVLDDEGHIRCQSSAVFDSILQNAEETKDILVRAVIDKLWAFSNAIAAVEIGYDPVSAMTAIGSGEPYKEILGGRIAGREDDVKYILENCYKDKEFTKGGGDSWIKKLSAKEDAQIVDFIEAKIEDVSVDIGGRYDVLPYTLIVRDGMIWSVCVMPDICPKEKRREVAMALMKINNGASVTLLHMDFDTGKIWSCYQLPVSAIRNNEDPMMRGFCELQMQSAAVLSIAVDSEKIHAAFTSDEED